MKEIGVYYEKLLLKYNSSEISRKTLIEQMNIKEYQEFTILFDKIIENQFKEKSKIKRRKNKTKMSWIFIELQKKEEENLQIEWTIKYLKEYLTNLSSIQQTERQDAGTNQRGGAHKVQLGSVSKTQNEQYSIIIEFIWKLISMNYLLLNDFISKCLLVIINQYQFPPQSNPSSELNVISFSNFLYLFFKFTKYNKFDYLLRISPGGLEKPRAAAGSDSKLNDSFEEGEEEEDEDMVKGKSYDSNVKMRMKMKMNELINRLHLQMNVYQQPANNLLQIFIYLLQIKWNYSGALSNVNNQAITSNNSNVYSLYNHFIYHNNHPSDLATTRQKNTKSIEENINYELIRGIINNISISTIRTSLRLNELLKSNQRKLIYQLLFFNNEKKFIESYLLTMNDFSISEFSLFNLYYLLLLIDKWNIDIIKLSFDFLIDDWKCVDNDDFIFSSFTEILLFNLSNIHLFTFPYPILPSLSSFFNYYSNIHAVQSSPSVPPASDGPAPSHSLPHSKLNSSFTMKRGGSEFVYIYSSILHHFGNLQKYLLLKVIDGLENIDIFVGNQLFSLYFSNYSRNFISKHLAHVKDFIQSNTNVTRASSPPNSSPVLPQTMGDHSINENTHSQNEIRFPFNDSSHFLSNNYLFSFLNPAMPSNQPDDGSNQLDEEWEFYECLLDLIIPCLLDHKNSELKNKLLNSIIQQFDKFNSKIATIDLSHPNTPIIRIQFNLLFRFKLLISLSDSIKLDKFNSAEMLLEILLNLSKHPIISLVEEGIDLLAFILQLLEIILEPLLSPEKSSRREKKIKSDRELKTRLWVRSSIFLSFFFCFHNFAFSFPYSAMPLRIDGLHQRILQLGKTQIFSPWMCYLKN